LKLHEKKDIDYDYLHEVVSEAFMPIAYGGGINSLEQARKLFSLGIEKVVLNSSAFLNPPLISQLAKLLAVSLLLFQLI
jgi:cyclase